MFECPILGLLIVWEVIVSNLNLPLYISLTPLPRPGPRIAGTNATDKKGMNGLRGFCVCIKVWKKLLVPTSKKCTRLERYVTACDKDFTYHVDDVKGMNCWCGFKGWKGGGWWKTAVKQIRSKQPSSHKYKYCRILYRIKKALRSTRTFDYWCLFIHCLEQYKAVQGGARWVEASFIGFKDLLSCETSKYICFSVSPSRSPARSLSLLLSLIP